MKIIRNSEYEISLKSDGHCVVPYGQKWRGYSCFSFCKQSKKKL